jgi:hypothetical protein
MGVVIMKMPEWTENEFDILARNYNVTVGELLKLLPGRTEGAIGVVREGVHAYHKGLNISMLSQIMKDYLAKNKGSITCPKCEESF